MLLDANGFIVRKDLQNYGVLKPISRKFVFFTNQIVIYQKLDKFTNQDLQLRFSKQVNTKN